MKRILFTAIISVLVCEAAVFSVQDDKSILEQIGVKRGICVLADDIGCENAVKLARKSELLIYVQLEGEKEVERAREAAADAGLYGKRIFVEKGELKLVLNSKQIEGYFRFAGLNKIIDTNISLEEAINSFNKKDKVGDMVVS